MFFQAEKYLLPCYFFSLMRTLAILIFSGIVQSESSRLVSIEKCAANPCSGGVEQSTLLFLLSMRFPAKVIK